MDQEKIGKFIREIRKKENLSQQKFAEKYGVTYQAVSKWENSKNIPDLAILKKMCQEYNMNLDELLETKMVPKTPKRNYIVLIVLLMIITVSTITATTILLKNNNNFEFKTVSTACKDFNLYGSIAYNNKTSSIYIDNITYCGIEDNSKYKKIECILYETTKKTKTEISKYSYNKNTAITLKEFLKKVNFNIDNYKASCKNYKENNLHLEIEATSDQEKITTYKLPLNLKDNCPK